MGFQNREAPEARVFLEDIVDCPERLNDDPRAPASSLSGGEARRLHLLRGLLAASEALLLDEACAGLDPASAAATLSEANALSAPVVLSVVHDLPADPASLGFTHRVRVEGGRVGPWSRCSAGAPPGLAPGRRPRSPPPVPPSAPESG